MMSSVSLPSNIWLWTCFIALLSMTMVSSGYSRVLCLVPTAMQFVWS